jgi:hypothetical protein
MGQMENLSLQVRFSACYLALVPVLAYMLSGSWVLLIFPALLAARSRYKRAVVFASLLGDSHERALDLYRFDLLRALHYPLPRNNEAEREFNKGLSKFLSPTQDGQDRHWQPAYQHEMCSSPEAAQIGEVRGEAKG